MQAPSFTQSQQGNAAGGFTAFGPLYQGAYNIDPVCPPVQQAHLVITAADVANSDCAGHSQPISNPQQPISSPTLQNSPTYHVDEKTPSGGFEPVSPAGADDDLTLTPSREQDVALMLGQIQEISVSDHEALPGRPVIR